MNVEGEVMMELNNLFKIKEDSNIELKKAKNEVPKSFWETYSAFANTDGGIVIFDIDVKKRRIHMKGLV